eukprot:g21545.t1
MISDTCFTALSGLHMFFDAGSFDKPIGLWNTSSLGSSSQMFGGNAAGQKPPCQAGREAGANYLMCEPCQVGLYAEAESHCQECPPGAVPSEDRGTCEQCPPMHYSVGGLDTCFACDLPLLLVDNHCVWWHLPLVTLGLGGLAVGSKLLRFLRQVRSALEMLQHSRGTGTDPTGTGVSFFMCFFVNNQYRLIVEECANGSDNLEDVFEGHLKRIGRMVAILDTWDQPVYLSRVWTVYEQYVASTIGVQVQFVLPKNVADRLRHQIAYVPAGIEDIIESLCQDTVGFKHVDMHVTDVMITWIGDVIEQTCTQLLMTARAKKAARSSTHGELAPCPGDVVRPTTS